MIQYTSVTATSQRPAFETSPCMFPNLWRLKTQHWSTPVTMRACW